MFGYIYTLHIYYLYLQIIGSPTIYHKYNLTSGIDADFKNMIKKTK